MKGTHQANRSRPITHAWVVEPCAPEVSASLARLSRAEDVSHIAIMPDVHLAKDVCVGVAMATSQLIYPAAIGSDIGCGMLAIKFDVNAELLADESRAGRILQALYEQIPSLKHGSSTVAGNLPSRLHDMPLSHLSLERLRLRDGLWQLGTLGRGNHFVELQSDEDHQLWLMIHSGSRGMGEAITQHHIGKAVAERGRQRFVSLDADSPAGLAYLIDLDWAIAYAECNRLAIAERVLQILHDHWRVGAIPESVIHANHNHVRREIHFGQSVWVHRKGALSANADEPGLIPGSMGTASYHVTGRGLPESLRSSSHGAGRVLSRAQALRTIGTKQAERELEGVWYDRRRLALLRDETPSAYRDIGAVMRAQRDLTRIVRRLKPVLSYKCT